MDIALVVRRRWLVRALGVAAVIGGIALLRRALGLEFTAESVRAVVEALGVWAPLAFIALVAFRLPLGVPSALALIAGGVLFGAGAGTFYGAIGLVICAVGLFLGARWAGGAAVSERLPERLRPVLEVAGSRAGALFIALGTAYPMSPISAYHLTAGVTRMTIPVFLLAVAIGSLGRAGLYTWFGSSLFEADRERLLLAGGVLAAALLVPLAFPAPRDWLLRGTRRGPEPVRPPSEPGPSGGV